MSDLKIKLILEAVDKATAPLRRVGAAVGGIAPKGLIAPMDEVGRRLKTIGAFGAKAGLALGGVFGAGAYIAKGVIDTAATFERLRTVLETTEGSATKAKTALAWVSDFAATTPFELNQVSEAFVKLRTYGMDPTQGLLRTLGDTAAAMGKDINQAVEAVADAVTGENERLKEFGIKASKEGEKIVYEYTANGETMRRSADASNRAMIQSTLEAIWNEKYGGAMEKLSGTWGGMLSNLSDQWTRFQMLLADAGIFELLKGKLKGLLDTINEMAANGQLQALATQIGGTLVDGAKAAFAVLEALAGAARGVGDAVKWMGDTFGWLLPIGQAVTDMAGMIWNAWSKLAGAIGSAAGAIGSAVSGLASVLGLGGGDGGAAPTRTATPSALPRGGAGAGGKVDGQVVVKFDNAPPGMRVQQVSGSGPLDIEADTGRAMAGGF